jgi:ABC-type branched-subunit amino acid transport system ATPase component
LTVAGRKRLELARALATDPKVLLLDEVLAGLNPSEIRNMIPVIRDLCRRGITILMIEHVMQAVMSLAEHVFVLAEGRIIAQGPPAQVVANPVVVEAYLGHGASGEAGSIECTLAPCSPSRDLHAGYGETEVLRGVDIAVDAGEIVAVLGSNGAGKSTLNRAISGVLRSRKGSIHFAGHMIEQEKPASIVSRGLIHVPEGRCVFPQSERERQPRSWKLPARIRPAASESRARFSAFSRALPSDNHNAPAVFRVASNKCWRSDAGSWPSRSCSSLTSRPWVFRRCWSRSFSSDPAHQSRRNCSFAGGAERCAKS